MKKNNTKGYYSKDLISFNKELRSTFDLLKINNEFMHRHLKPDFVHVMMEGNIIASGDMKLAELLEEKGYEMFKNNLISGCL
ncbi:MAG: hypothetical protein A2Y62_17995 [Candidatus Fischerbacteria bacterium RBG_13_37_8]|uniref:Uncharacterized protein n=1 Tax=Candidatus Fischerbacteria bacterium RBG_13_37_8 TaxID=1817863 RepID=A0A1F5VW08_9BACT|nr:MAG: hypothetical protein A2Y62_17995 [Candidatus Fischerbacteria bacterium RBG_13_37_8]